MLLRTYVSAERGRCLALATAIGVHRVLVSQWAGGTRGVPIEHCLAIEQATGGAVSRRELRPSDWQRIWPDIGAVNQEPIHGA